MKPYETTISSKQLPKTKIDQMVNMDSSTIRSLLEVTAIHVSPCMAENPLVAPKGGLQKWPDVFCYGWRFRGTILIYFGKALSHGHSYNTQLRVTMQVITQFTNLVIYL